MVNVPDYGQIMEPVTVSEFNATPNASRAAAFRAIRATLTGPVGDFVEPLDLEWEALDGSGSADVYR